jgi:hypothetical protein
VTGLPHGKYPLSFFTGKSRMFYLFTSSSITFRSRQDNIQAEIIKSLNSEAPIQKLWYNELPLHSIPQKRYLLYASGLIAGEDSETIVPPVDLKPTILQAHAHTSVFKDRYLPQSRMFLQNRMTTQLMKKNSHNLKNPKLFRGFCFLFLRPSESSSFFHIKLLNTYLNSSY